MVKKIYEGSGAIWDPEQNRVIADFGRGKFIETDDEALQQFLEKRGYKELAKPKPEKPKIDPLYKTEKPKKTVKVEK